MLIYCVFYGEPAQRRGAKQIKRLASGPLLAKYLIFI
jgi:hypothetical protein